MDNCRIICTDFKTDPDSKIKGIEPQLVDPIENIFDEIYKKIVSVRKTINRRD